MPYQSEFQLRENADLSTLRIFNLWHTLCNEKLGQTIEIIANNSQEHPQYGKMHGGTASFALPYIQNGKIIALCLWITNFPKVDNIILTHELGHPIMRMMEFKTVKQTIPNQKNPRTFIDILLNSLCDHIIIYKLQRKMGHDPQKWIDDRAKHDLKFVAKKFSRPSVKVIPDSLLFADDIFNSSERIAKLLFKRSMRFHPDIFKNIQKIISILPQYNPNIPEENLKCRFKLVDELKLQGAWTPYDDIETYKQWI